jgi:hypothetical protein
MAISVLAQQQGINYKALIKDANGNVLASAPVIVKFIVFDANVNNFYQETHDVETEANGFVTLNIGDGTTSDTFSDINWESDNHFLNVEIDTGNGLVNLGSTQFMAVPYAKHANTATTVLNGVTRINDLSDGKSDNDGTNDGSSLFLGVDAGANDDGTDNQNAGVGYQALYSNTTGQFNTASGFEALYSNTTAFGNTANGFHTLYTNTSGYANTANGARSLELNTTGHSNTANGSFALTSNTTGFENTANGVSALGDNTTGSNNTANGYWALNNNTTGSNNTANGFESLRSNVFGDYNTANGTQALYSAYLGSNSTAYGYQALYSNEVGNQNTAIGTQALYNAQGSRNVALGYKAGYFETGSNRLYIANSDTTTPLIYGNFSAPSLTLNATTAINGNTLVNGSLVVTGGNVIVNSAVVHASDKRLKKDIEDLPYGLKEVLQLQPKAYNWKDRKTDHKSLGLIAQDVQLLIKEVVTAQDDDKKTLGVSYTELIPVLINAIKEQQGIIEALQTKNQSKDIVLTEVLKRLKSLENTTITGNKEENTALLVSSVVLEKSNQTPVKRE